MLHACLCTICFLFYYTSWHFYAFSGTNLLTRCHSASSCFLLFLCFRKVTQEIFSESDKTKAEFPIFPNTRRGPKKRRRGGAEGSRTMPWRKPPPGYARLWCGPLVHPPDIALPPIYSARRENPKSPNSFPENILQAAGVIHARSGGSRSSSRHPVGEGNHHRRPSSSPCLPPE
jgi:hypothetical protein